MSRCESSRRRLAQNPFFVLALPHDCSRAEMERQGNKLLAMLEVDIGDASRYSTPFGPRQRTAEMVRESMAALRDPEKRLAAEMWARATLTDEGCEPVREPEPPGPRWDDALTALGWRR